MCGRSQFIGQSTMSTQRTAGNYEEWESHQWMDYDTFEEVS